MWLEGDQGIDADCDSAELSSRGDDLGGREKKINIFIATGKEINVSNDDGTDKGYNTKGRSSSSTTDRATAMTNWRRRRRRARSSTQGEAIDEHGHRGEGRTEGRTDKEISVSNEDTGEGYNTEDRKSENSGSVKGGTGAEEGRRTASRRAQAIWRGREEEEDRLEMLKNTKEDRERSNLSHRMESTKT